MTHGTRTALTALLVVPQVLLVALLLGIAGRCVVMMAKNGLDQERVCLAVIPICLGLSAGFIATAYGLIRRLRTAFFVSAGFAVLLLPSAGLAALRGSRIGQIGALCALFLLVCHFFIYDQMTE